MKPTALVRALLLALVVSATGAVASGETIPGSAQTPPLILISLDGFRWDYCALHPERTPNLRRMMREGVSARGLIPAFPSNTFPNHYTLVTGLYPSHHGIVNNHMFDPRLGTYFHYNRPESVHDDRWWQGEPIWVTAVKQGRRSACSFWVGSEAKIGGVRPTYWKRFDPKLPFEPRLEELIGWLTQPPAQRPDVVTFYLEETNSVGHRFGPDSPELLEALQQADDRIGSIRSRLEAAHIAANFVIVSDHGMTGAGTDRVILLDDYLDLTTVQIDFEESSAGLRPLPGTTVEAVMTALHALPPAAKAYRAQDLPARFHIDAENPRVPPVWIVPAEGWHVERRSLFEATKQKFVKGQHGYDPALPAMRGLLVASGPSFKSSGAVLDEVENVHVYNLLCAALHLSPAPNDGDDRLVRAMLK